MRAKWVADLGEITLDAPSTADFLDISELFTIDV